MSITVVFDKSGFYHPAYGRMGLGKNQGIPYVLPDAFKNKGRLPASARIIKGDEVDAALEEAEVTKPIKPKVVDETQYEQAVAPPPMPEPASEMSARRRKLDED